jgi:hypothetical protein
MTVHDLTDIRRRATIYSDWLKARKNAAYAPGDVPENMRPGAVDAIPTNEEFEQIKLADWQAERHNPTPGKWVGYLSADRKTITTGPGTPIARIVSITSRKCRDWTTDERGSFRAVGTNGIVYVGTHNGTGMWARLRPAKKNGQPIILSV